MKELSPEEFSQNLRKAMKRAGFPERGGAQRLAEYLPFEISHVAISKWMNGKGSPSTGRLKIVADVLKTTTDMLLSIDSKIDENVLPEPVYKANPNKKVYQILSGSLTEVELQLNLLASEGWKPDGQIGIAITPDQLTIATLIVSKSKLNKE